MDDLPESLDETYERTLREINKANWEFAHRLLQFVAVAVRPLRVEELAELLAFDFEAGPIPKFREDWRLEDPIHAILSTCPSFLSVCEEHSDPMIPLLKVVQFSHFSVKEFLNSPRLSSANDIILRRFHISETPAHSLAASACLGYLIHLDKNFTSDSLRSLPFTDYVEHWVDHVRREDVPQNVKDGLKELLDPSKPHLAVCIWICDPSLLPWEQRRRSEKPSPPRGTPLHYVALWDLYSIVELLINELSQNVDSKDFTGSATPLHLASSNGHMKIAHRLLECNADVKAENKDKETPLHVASKGGHLEVARMLIERGASVSAQNKDGQISLHVASQYGHLDVASMLIEGDADVSARDKDGQTPLHLVFIGHKNPVFPTLPISRHPEVAPMLIKCGADVSAQNKDGQTPLHLALLAKELGAVRMLIERNADVSMQDIYGQTPLHLLFIGNWDRFFGTSHRLKVACMLIEHGADLSAQNKDGQTPLHLALPAHELDAARLLIERGADVSVQDKDGQTPLHLVFIEDWKPLFETSRYPEVARMLIERDADVSAPNKYGQTPLHLASQAGLDAVRMLIERVVDVSAQDNDGQTPLHLAAQVEDLDVDAVRMLIERGADVSVRDNDDQTPLHVLFIRDWHPFYGSSRRPEVARMMIERGADVSSRDNHGQTPLHLASHARGELAAICMLVDCGADVSVQDKDGQTPLHLLFIRDWGSYHGTSRRSEVARMLIEHGADVSAKDNSGRTPLHHLASQAELDAVRVLIELGASLSAEDNDGRTPMDLASQAEQLEVVRMLGADLSAQN